MISPETLRRFRFFGRLNEKQLNNLAMIGKEVHLEDNQTLFEEGEPAQALYFLLEGSIDLYYTIQEAYRPSDRKEIAVGDINAGELFGISTLIEPYILTSTARSNGTSRAIQFDGETLKKSIAEDSLLELELMRKMAQTAIERLHATRTQLAAALV
jgi:CRP-like cAMP-binding protein